MVYRLHSARSDPKRPRDNVWGVGTAVALCGPHARTSSCKNHAIPACASHEEGGSVVDPIGQTESRRTVQRHADLKASVVPRGARQGALDPIGQTQSSGRLNATAGPRLTPSVKRGKTDLRLLTKERLCESNRVNARGDPIGQTDSRGSMSEALMPSSLTCSRCSN